MNQLFRLAGSLALVVFVGVTTVSAANGVWTSADDKTLPEDFAIQGEYESESEPELGAQIIALGDGQFQAVIIPGGLPTTGHPGDKKCLLHGEKTGPGAAKFKGAEGNRKYLGNKPAEFSATKAFPPAGQDAFEEAVVGNGVLTVVGSDGKVQRLKKFIRESPTAGKEPPGNAIVLFNGTAEDLTHWKGGRVDEQTKLLNTDGKDILTAEKFNNYTMHLEFKLPYKPAGRGQGRGNSGFYQVDHYEVQILDSFGLAGLNNECGGVYQIKDPDVNMCFPPLSWQTYDVEFANAVTAADGKVKTPAKMTVKLNGVVIHDNIELPRKTGGSRRDAIGTPGPIKLQGHGNPLQFRNVWIVPGK